MGLGDVIGKAVGAATGAAYGSTLEDFLTKFTPAGGAFVNQIDPLHTFEVSFKFFPNELASTGSKSAGQKALDSLKQSGADALNNLANNVTGGLAGAWANSKKKGIQKSHDRFTPGTKTFMEYLAEASLLLNSDNVLGALKIDFGSTKTSPVELQLGFYIQNIDIPQMKMEDGGTSDTLLGKFPANGRFVMPDNNNLRMDVINTKLPLMEMIFYPWMREVTLPYWSYDDAPYTTAIITVDFSKHQDIQYIFYGCRPNQIETMHPTQEPDTTITRQVSFAFDFMLITSGMKTSESVKDKLLGTAAGLAGSASNMLNL